MFALIGVGLLDYMCFGGNQGRMSPVLAYEKLPLYSATQKLVNLCVVILVFIGLFFVAKKLSKLCRQLLLIAALCMAIMCISSMVKVNRSMQTYKANGGKLEGKELFELSTEGNNVVVFMLDRAISGYIPYIFAERPDIAEQFADFTYYPNTVTYGHTTNFATPALFGGYEYTPEQLNTRTDESLREKQNEALKVMPAVFAEQGYEVTVCDPPYANYEWVPDLSIFDDMEHVQAYRTEGAFRESKLTTIDNVYKRLQQSNFVYYGITKMAPLIIRAQLYNVGSYCSTVGNSNNLLNEGFKNSYTALVSLKDMTGIVEDDSNHFLMLQNSTTHEPVVLKMPEYIPANDVVWEEELQKMPEHVVDGKKLDINDYETLSYYQINVAALQAVADWISFLKQQNVYDNTRIVIVSDHGEGLGQFGFAGDIDIEAYNSLLLVKDFGETSGEVSGEVPGDVRTSDEFMTIADVPYLAMKDLIRQPVNPFTGNVISNAEKYTSPQKITTSSLWDVTTNNGNVFDTSDGEWYEIKDNIFDPACWIRIE
ncbi:MAG: hypothetical protein Q4D54_04625 [Eubacteriales bacterium]|nr:hypothetical protein [Eubacteriales bacterium]